VPPIPPLAVLAPPLLAAVTLVLAMRLWRRDLPERAGAWAVPLAFGLAVVPGIVTADAWTLPPKETWHWVAVVVTAAAAVGVLEAFVPAGVAWPLRIALAVAAALALVGHWMKPPWLWRVVTAAAILAVTGAVDDSARRSRGASVPAAACVAALLGSVTMLALHNIRLPWIAASLAAWLGVTAVLAAWRPRVSLAGPGATVTGVVLPAVLLTAFFHATGDTPRWTALLATAAPCALLLDRLPVVANRRPWVALTLRVLAVAVPAGAAAAIAMRAYLAEPDLGY